MSDFSFQLSDSLLPHPPLACSPGKICAKYPTSAGAYYWCFRLAAPRRRLLLSWIDGWLTMWWRVDSQYFGHFHEYSWSAFVLMSWNTDIFREPLNV
ncbi:hypothetical protein B0H16DRAFT_1553974, partial [Mycena metata]